MPYILQVTEHQKGADGAKPAEAAKPDPKTAEQQQLAAGPAAGTVAVEPPEEEKYTVHVPEGLTYFDLDLIKLTAQFVARNGKGFLTGANKAAVMAALSTTHCTWTPHFASHYLRLAFTSGTV